VQYGRDVAGERMIPRLRGAGCGGAAGARPANSQNQPLSQQNSLKQALLSTPNIGYQANNTSKKEEEEIV
jgi:hypothetical protein